MMSKRPDRMDFYFLIIITVFFIVFFIMSFSLTRIAGTVPKLISGIASILCMVLLLKKFLTKDAAEAKNEEKPAVNQGIPVYKTLLVLTGYVLGLPVLGFALSTFIVLALWPVLLGNRNYLKNIAFSVISTGVFYFAVQLFNIRLPMGILFKSIFK